MSIFSEKINDYAVLHSQKESPLLKELHRETWQKVINPRMLSGEIQGRLLSLLSKLIKPNVILEIGTYTGYSALCLAEGLAPNGKLITIDKNVELEAFSKKYFEKSEFDKNIHQLVGNALDIIPNLTQKFDLVFIDADKSNYSNYFDLIIDKMQPGGIIISDNVLWSGKVLDPEKYTDKDTKALIAYNKKINEDKRVETLLLPIRDGITVSRVK